MTVMSIARKLDMTMAQKSSRALCFAILGIGSPVALSQRTTAPTAATEAMLALPDAPGTLSASASEPAASATADDAIFSSSVDRGDAYFDPSTPAPTKQASRYKYSIAPNETTTKMTVGQKVLGGFKDSTSLFSAAGWISAAGWSHLTNGTPNYGTNSTAFAQRFGAAVARGVSEGVFGKSVFAPILHLDPRYYQMGKNKPFFKRVVYASTRTVITRTDGGRNVPNFSLLLGNLSGSALAQVYYPPPNIGGKEVAITFGGSLAGATIGFLVQEFVGDTLRIVRDK
jgi:hypothetical protein